MHYKLIVGNQAYSSWSLRGWLLLRAYGLDFDYEVLPLYCPEWEDFQKKLYPAATVPALEVGGDDGAFMLWDSLAMAEFLNEQHPGLGYWPAGAAARAAARSLAAEMHSSYAALRSTMPMNVRRVYRTIRADAETQADIDRITGLWAWARERFGGAGPYLFGSQFGAIDAFYAPVASRFRTYSVPLEPAASAYVEALLEHPATREFCEAGEREPWVMDFNEFDCD